MLRRYRAFRELADPSTRRRAGLAALALAGALALVMVLAAFASERAQGPRVSALVYPATLVHHLESPAVEGVPGAIWWDQPAAVAVREGRWFVLDTGNDRILKLDGAGTVRRVIDGGQDGRLALRGPMSIASDGRYLYVANSGASQVLVLEPDGQVVRELSLEKEEGDAAPPRPIGLAVSGNGDILVSDADNQRVLRYDAGGRPLEVMGSGERGGGGDGFNTPAGLAVDGLENVYVVDVLNGRVVKLSAEGAFLRQFGRLGDTAGTLSRPKDVAVDAAGNVYVSDGLTASVQVFGPKGEYLGLIGRQDPGDRNSASIFRAPAGLTISEGKLYVMDRFAGLFVFELPGQG